MVFVSNTIRYDKALEILYKPGRSRGQISKQKHRSFNGYLSGFWSILLRPSLQIKSFQVTLITK